MTATVLQSRPPLIARSEKAMAFALRLAHAEKALQALTFDQVDAIVDPDGRAYLLRPAQEQMRRNEQHLQSLIDSVADAIMVVNRQGAILSLNHSASRVLGYEPEELVGTSLFERVHEADLSEIYAAFFQVIEGFNDIAKAQFFHRNADNSCRLLDATVGRLRDASQASVVFSIRPAAPG